MLPDVSKANVLWMKIKTVSEDKRYKQSSFQEQHLGRDALACGSGLSKQLVTGGYYPTKCVEFSVTLLDGRATLGRSVGGNV